MDSALTNLECLIALVLLGFSLPALGRAYQRAWAIFGPRADADGRAVGIAVLLAAVARWLLAPRWIATMYIGYIATERAIELSAASHYGVGSQALYHALFAFLPHDHRFLLWTNSALGVLVVPLFAAFAARALHDKRAGAIAALLLALVPLFIRNDNSDANNVPCLLWLLGGLVLWEEYLEGGDRGPLLASFALLVLAAIGRPEMPILVPAWAAVTTLAAAPARARLRDPALYALLAVAAALIVPHALHVQQAALTLRETGSLPGYSHLGLSELRRALLTYDTVLWPSLFPVPLLAFAIWALVDRGPARLLPRLALLALALFSLVLYGVDLCRANMARVHVPGALLVTALAAAGIARARVRFPGALAGVALALTLVVAAIPTARRLWAPTNEQAEDDFLREALGHLPAERFTLVRIAREDRVGSDATHFHFPDYLVRPPMSPGRASSIGDFTVDPDWTAPAFFYAGTRCYADFRDEGTPAPHGTNEQPACARMRERFRLEPLLERDLPNRGDVWLEYYGDAPALHVGLYRIRPREPAGATP